MTNASEKSFKLQVQVELPKKKAKLFTHNDLDGKGCEIVGRLAFPNIDVVTTRNPKDASEKVEAFLESPELLEYDTIFITDISVTDEVAQMIEDKIAEFMEVGVFIHFVLLDHHQTAEYLNKYDWAFVQVGKSPNKNSGTNMFYEYLVTKGHFLTPAYRDALTIFVEKVRRYDSWEWKTHFKNDSNALDLNALFWLLGSEQFVKNTLEKFRTHQIFAVSEGEWLGMFDKADRIVLRLDDAKKESYIDRKESQMIVKVFNGHEVGVVYAEQYISELGNVLSERNPELDYIMLIDMGARRVSLRTANDGIELGKEVSSQFGGGGHAKASGFEFADDVLNKTFKSITTKPNFLTKIIDKLTGN